MPRPRMRFFVDEDTGAPLKHDFCSLNSVLYLLVGMSAGIGLALRYQKTEDMPEILQFLSTEKHGDPLIDCFIITIAPLLCSAMQLCLPLVRFGVPIERLVLVLCLPYLPLRLMFGRRLWPLLLVIVLIRFFLAMIIYIGAEYGWQPTWEQREELEDVLLANGTSTPDEDGGEKELEKEQEQG